MDTNKDFREIKFKNVGRLGQYEVDLFKIGERPFDIEAPVPSHSYTEEQLGYIHRTVTNYLQEKGFENPRGKFQLINGNIVRCEDTKLHSMTLHQAIEKRDANTGGQSGIYLAAYAEYWCWRLRLEWDGKFWEKPNSFGWILDHAMLVQDYFFKLFLYEHQSVVSSGRIAIKNCNEKAKKPRPGGRSAHIAMIKELLRPYKKDEIPFKTLLNNLENGAVKDLILTKNGEKYQVFHDDADGPSLSVTAGTIRDWYSSCCDQPQKT